MISSILRRISQKAAATANVRGLIDTAKHSPLRGLSNLAANSQSGSNNSLQHGSNSRISSSPWLMLPPSFEGNENTNIMVFNFYSLADNTVRKFCNERVGILLNDVDDIKFVSSCHGWLALFSRRNLDLVLFNPISGRHIKLPSIKPLNMDGLKIRYVTKLITSCSPEEKDCLIMLSFGEYRRLAFCSPTSTEWTRIGSRHHKGGKIHDPLKKCFDDFVYSTTQKRLYCITNSMFFEAWDFQDTVSPNILEMDPEPKHDPIDEDDPRLADFFLVVAEESGDLFWVRRYIMTSMGIDGSHDKTVNHLELPYKTIGFDVYKYDPEISALVYIDGSLDGLSFFIGNNHSFAISASEFPELQPNSIYFTDADQVALEEYLVNYDEMIPKKPFGGHDIGIFDFENKSFAPCYYPCDRQSVKRIMPAPMWFTPTY